MVEHHTGMHPFCYFPCNSFIFLPNDYIGSIGDGKKVIDHLFNEINTQIKQSKPIELKNPIADEA